MPINQMTENLKKTRFTLPAMTFLLVVLGYGLLIPSMGYYWDDWPFAWFLRFFGPAEFIDAFRPYRPLLGPIFAVTTALFGGSPITWQVIGLVTRFLLSIELWFVLRWTWPSQKWNLLWVVFLFTVYPGYQQQWVAFTHVNQEFIPLLWLIASFGATVHALRNARNRTGLTILALMLQALGLFSTEYFFGLEILRVLLLIVLFSESSAKTMEVYKRAGLHWLPYFIVWGLNAIWTYTFHQSATYNSYDINILSGTTLSLLSLTNEILTTFSLSGFTSWLNTFQMLSALDGSLTQLLALAVLLVAGAAAYVSMSAAYDDRMNPTPNGDNRWSLQAMSIGLAGMFAGRLPSWAAGLPLKLEFDYDRFMVSIMLGASLFIVGLATYILKDGKRKIVLLSMLIGLSTAYQFTVANTFRRDWANQQAFFWQLAWRMPALQKNTVLLTSELPLKYVSDLQVTAGLNWMYAPALDSRELPYALLYIKTRLNSSILPTLQPDETIQFQYRTVPFFSSTSNSLVIYKDADGCLRVLDPVFGTSETVPGANYFLLNAIPLSNLNQIQTGAPEPGLDQVLFGAEPEHGWCYFYEKAELARQGMDWDQVVNLYDQARNKGFRPSMPVENLPFIEGYAMLGKTDMAFKLMEDTLKQREDLCPAIYSLWDRVAQSSSLTEAEVSELHEQIRRSGCRQR